MKPQPFQRTLRSPPAKEPTDVPSAFGNPLDGLYDPELERDGCGVGFIASRGREPSRQVVDLALGALRRLLHRGAFGADPRTGDGAGLLIQIPDAFLRRVGAEQGIALPRRGRYAVATVFLPRQGQDRDACRVVVEAAVAEARLRVLGWREVPVRPRAIGPVARSGQPVIEQLFISGRPGRQLLEDALYPVRKRIESRVHALSLRDPSSAGLFAVTSCSSATLIYKGQLSATQLEPFYPDLSAPDLASQLALFHQRFSTNTDPSWRLAQPFRFIAHNGEINTLRGNVNWMQARERGWRHPICGAGPEELLPIVEPQGSDSGALDNTIELLIRTGRSLPEALMMTIPEAWEEGGELPAQLRAFYRYQANLIEPWDGPAAITCSDGRWVGAALDRNGLRPARYSITDELVVLASEIGVVDLDPALVRRSGRLEPGHMIMVDTASGRVLDDHQIKRTVTRRHPYQQLSAESLYQLPSPSEDDRLAATVSGGDLTAWHHCYGYTDEELSQVLGPMAVTGHEAIGSMGNDAALAVLSERPRLLYDYFSQSFAQVTNPPIDSIRERCVMSLRTTLGGGGELVAPDRRPVTRLELQNPVLTDGQLRQIQSELPPNLRTRTLSAVFEVAEEGDELERALDRLCAEALLAVEDEVRILIITDREAGPELAPIPCLLAVGAIHQHLVRAGARSALSLVAESADARSVHHLACLIGHGAEAVNPYLGLDSVAGMASAGLLTEPRDRFQAQASYIQCLQEGLLKVMSKMGISTLSSYCGAQVFEAVGIARPVMDRCFSGTPSRLSGAGFAVLAEEVRRRHRRAFHDFSPTEDPDLGGDHRWRHQGESHAWNPESVAALQHAVRGPDLDRFRRFTDLADARSAPPTTLRHLLDLTSSRSVPIDEVEQAPFIVRRFATGAMSLGSIGQEAHETMALAMNQIGGKSNTGEGGEDPERFAVAGDGSSRRSAIKQVASARFGVTVDYLVNADDIQIKIAQGAKPGEGGQLPGHKVDANIARLRHAVPGLELISPPPHHDIYSIEDLAQLIWDLKQANPTARVSVKLVSQAGVGTVAAGVVKARADHITISGHDGGTGAAPLSSIKHVGIPWELGLAETQQALVRQGLRSRVTIQADGGLRTGRDVVIAALLGAEEFGFATAALVATGCILMRVCHLNSCPVGIATQDPILRRRFSGEPEHVVRFFMMVAEDVRRHMAELGFRKVSEMVGRVDRLGERTELRPWKAAGLDLAPLLHAPVPGPAALRRGPRRADVEALSRSRAQEHYLDAALDLRLLDRLRSSILSGTPGAVSARVRNSDRAVGARLSGEVARRYGQMGLAADTLQVTLHGVAGQSLGAWLAPGISLTCTGAANDYPGKGLSGGRLVVRTPARSGYAAAANVIIGNVALYGATSGEAYFEGQAGHRFAVRNSGATAVVEGIGDHGCEYMTGGTVLVLGSVGQNFGAGMSGGVAYVLATSDAVRRQCNPVSVEVTRLDQDDLTIVKDLLQRHAGYTRSQQARRLLADWTDTSGQLVLVRPRRRGAGVSGVVQRVQDDATETAAALA
ncbi:MAG TPA: glutamate synthase large subunit [Candidatus Dormibacteraeota bacterium]|nr:glutamate synthase large subunit [Candidatus Dormibacteraeota bacterium]